MLSEMLSDAVGYAVAALMRQSRPRGPGMRGTVSTMVVAPRGCARGWRSRWRRTACSHGPGVSERECVTRGRSNSPGLK